MVVEKILKGGNKDETVLKNLLGKSLGKNEVKEQVQKAKSEKVGTSESVVHNLVGKGKKSY